MWKNSAYMRISGINSKRTEKKSVIESFWDSAVDIDREHRKVRVENRYIGN